MKRALGARRAGRGAATLLMLVALLISAWHAASTAVAAPIRAGNSPWTGTFTIEMQQTYSNNQGAGSSDQITASCSATIHRHADGTASATATYTSKEVRTQVTDAQTGSGATTTTQEQGTASFPQYSSPPSFNLAGNGNYTVAAAPPQIQVQVDNTYQQTGSTPITQHYVSSASCGTSLAATRRLPGGTTVTGSTSESLFEGIKVTMEWTIQDSTLQPIGTTGSKQNEKPTGKIKVTNNGIDASLDYKGWEIGYSGDWKASQQKPGAPAKISSPDQKVTITLQVQPAAGQPSTAATKTAIHQAGQAAGHVKAITYRPIALGTPATLSGLIGVVTFTNSPNTLLIAVVSNGQQQTTAQTLVTPHTPPLDVLQAGMAIGSLQPAG